MKTKIYVIRHAEAEGNIYCRCHGQFESSVTANGLRQIEALSRRFDGETVDACYSSDLLRTRVTARAICAPRGLALRLDPRFREVNLGAWEDVPFGQLEWEQGEMLRRFNSDPYHWHVDGAEDFETYSARIVEGLREVAERHAGGTVAVFAHGAVIRGMQLRLFHAEARSLGHCDNTGVNLLEYEDGAFRAVYLNDDSHMPRELSTLAQQSWWRAAEGGVSYELWFRPMEPDPAWYTACRRAAWESVYGPAGEFDGMAYYRAARDIAARWPEAVCDVMAGGKRVGLVQLSPERTTPPEAGYISFLYLEPEYRGMGLGVQLLGQAISFYRRMGRTRLQLSVSPRNQAALAFYRRWGFQEIGSTPGQFGNLILMDRDVALDRYAALAADVKNGRPKAAIL